MCCNCQMTNSAGNVGCFSGAGYKKKVVTAIEDEAVDHNGWSNTSDTADKL
jgi:hypothetical protein